MEDGTELPAGQDDRADVQLVGVDGSSGSTHALRWALARRERLGDVEPVTAWHVPWWALVPTATGTLLPTNTEEFAGVARRVATRALDRVAAGDHREPLVVHGAAGPALVGAAEHGSLLVVGTRGRGSVTASLLGSVSLHCVHHASVPVVVVPPDAPIDDKFDRVVVGIDGSKHGLSALEWAIDNVAATSRIDVIHVWHSDTTVAEIAALAAERIESQSRDLVADALHRFAERISETGREVVGSSRRGDARRVLGNESAQADLLVVGARGHGGLAHLFVGSVATSLVHQPRVPTVVVR